MVMYWLSLSVPRSLEFVVYMDINSPGGWLILISRWMISNIKANITATNGKVELMLDAPLPLKTFTFQSSISINNAINEIDGKWCQITVQANPLLGAQVLIPSQVKLTRSQGPLSELLNELDVSTILRMDILKDVQMVLKMPTPLEAFGNITL